VKRQQAHQDSKHKRESAPRTYVIEVGPITLRNHKGFEEPKTDMEILRDMEQLIRDYWRVGQRNSLVRSSVRS
jgi:hypothetical protein